MAPVTFSLVLPTRGRATLGRTLRSLLGQDWRDGDEILLAWDGPPDDGTAYAAAEGLANPLPLRFLHHPFRMGYWGYPLRDWVIRTQEPKGTHLIYLDDDDEYTPGAVAAMRAAVEELRRPRPLLFRMHSEVLGRTVWSIPWLVMGNVSTQLFCHPNLPGSFGLWGSRYYGDYDFISTTCAHFAGGPVWRDELTCVQHADGR